MKFRSIYSPNFNKEKRTKKFIKFIIIHYTGMQSEGESIKRLTDKNWYTEQLTQLGIIKRKINK